MRKVSARAVGKKKHLVNPGEAGPSVDSILSSPQAKYRIKGPLGEGGRGRTFLACVEAKEDDASADVPKVGTDVVIKIGKIEEKRGQESTLSFIDFVDKKLVEEKRALSKLKGLRCVAQVIDSGTYRVRLFGSDSEPRFLVQQFVKGTVLADTCIGGDGGAKFTGIKEATLWFRFAITIAEALLAVHQRGIVHNDIWHRNIMLRESGEIVFIDFGEAIFRIAHRLAYLDQPHRRDPWIDPEWNLARIRPSRRADIFALGGVLFWLACGSEPPMPEPDKERSKAEIETEINERNPGLLKQNLLIADVIARCRRYDRKERISDAESLRRELITYGRPMTAAQPVETAKRILNHASLRSKDKNPFLARWADIFLRRAERQLEDMSSDVIEVSGNHEVLVSGCVEALASLEEGDEYLAVSTLKFWKPGNIGVRGRFFSMTNLCAQRGVKIRRLFLLTEADKRDDQFWPIASAQMDLQEANRACANDCLQTKFLLLQPKHFDERVRDGDHCGYWISGRQVMSVVPVYDAQDVLRSVRLIVSDVAPEIVRRNFTTDFASAKPWTQSALSTSP